MAFYVHKKEQNESNASSWQHEPRNILNIVYFLPVNAPWV